MTTPSTGPVRDGDPAERHDRVDAQLEALHERWQAVRASVTELYGAGAEASRAVEPDVRRLLGEMRQVLDRAADQFQQARVAGAGGERGEAASAPPAPPALPAVPGEPKAAAPAWRPSDDAAGPPDRP